MSAAHDAPRDHDPDTHRDAPRDCHAANNSRHGVASFREHYLPEAARRRAHKSDGPHPAMVVPLQPK